MQFCSAENRHKKSKGHSKSPKKNQDNDSDPILAGEAHFKSRLAAVNELKKNTETHPYPHNFNTSLTLKQFAEKYNYLENEEILENVSESVAGRIHSIRRASSKLAFIDLRGDGFKVQVKAAATAYASVEKYAADIKLFHRGDIIGVTGSPSRTKRGELSLIPNKVILSYF